MITQPFAEINIFEPHGMELFVKPADSIPRYTFDHEERSCGLIYRGDSIGCQPNAVFTVHRIRRPDAV